MVPSCKSFKNVLDAVGEPLIKAKLQFFVPVARITLPFLEAYQTDKPMLPFLATDLGVLVKDLMSRYLKPEIMSTANSVTALVSIVFDNKENFIDAGKVNVGFSASQTL
ncbi:hypothetical protein ACJMK2_019600 [Sinanodonta woodiana]|uniref:Uncharacterized protein n=1 Tax=Sinanodonta woodiana TaxID=1069815 RepID=A0ABD3TZQ0_SINWO